ncbi:cryptochrome/photolyase family protein [Kiritimatiellaeota bacterium B1221]|nr:cryptochrome/photolyase family protein [Kiritimatiellaeota bacterium B1221]
MQKNAPIRNLLIILGDQLNEDSRLFDNYDPDHDLLWMAETQEESTHVWCHKIRLVLFFSAMRHFRDAQTRQNRKIRYHELQADPVSDRGGNFNEILSADLQELKPQKIQVVLPGDFRVTEMLQSAANSAGIELEILPDRHFYVSPEEFSDYSRGRKNLVMEPFYRMQRKRFGILMDSGDQPEGGEWNYDAENRGKFGKQGPKDLPPPPQIRLDSRTKEVIALVEKRFAEHPGETDSFDWPVTREDAKACLHDFILHRLPLFGKYEDAMWKGGSPLYHSRLSALLNLKLLNPRECVDAAIAAYQNNRAPLNSVEGFVRQLLGWREFIRGIYFQEMPEYAEMNALACEKVNVPTFFWDGKTDMACVADTMHSVLKTAWSHHIPRLMVLGQFSLLLGVHPYHFHAWHMAMYADAIDWVSLPNTLGMSQYGDGGIVGSKPYCASGNYINKMSNYCSQCKYHYKAAHGENACPFTTLYWDFLDRHQQALSKNHRMGFQLNNLKRKSDADLKKIRKHADVLRQKCESKIRF